MLMVMSADVDLWMCGFSGAAASSQFLWVQMNKLMLQNTAEAGNSPLHRPAIITCTPFGWWCIKRAGVRQPDGEHVRMYSAGITRWPYVRGLNTDLKEGVHSQLWSQFHMIALKHMFEES